MNRIRIEFKYFEYGLNGSLENSYLKGFEAQFSTDGGKNYKILMAAKTADQTARTWAWIDLIDKQHGETIYLLALHHLKMEASGIIEWGDFEYRRLEVKNHPRITNQTWLTVIWYPRINQNKNTTHIRILARWYNCKTNSIQGVSLLYDNAPKKAMLNSNSLYFSNSLPEQEIRIEDTINTINAYKEANAIVVKGAVNERIQVYTTTGKLVKSLVANRDELPISLPANQLYIVHVGQISYKIAM